MKTALGVVGRVTVLTIMAIVLYANDELVRRHCLFDGVDEFKDEASSILQTTAVL